MSFTWYLYKKRDESIEIGETCLNTLYLLENREDEKELDENVKKMIEILKRIKENIENERKGEFVDPIIMEVKKELMRKIEYDETNLLKLIDKVISDLEMKKKTEDVEFLLKNLLLVTKKISFEAIWRLNR